MEDKILMQKHIYLSVVCMFVLWLYLFLSFRPLGLPVLFGQVEEWTLSAVMLSITGLFLFASICRKKKFTIRITVCDILMFLYLIYILLRLDKYQARQEYILSLYTLTLLYVIIRVLNVRPIHCIIPVLVFSLFFQVFDAFYRHDSTWNLIPEITGIFHNTGILGCLVAIVSTSIYGLLLFSRQNKVLLSIVLLFSVVVLVYSQSRAAWISAFAGIGFLSFIFLRKKYSSRMIRPTILTILFSIPVFIYAVKKLYLLKPVSADGRFYIWKISSQMLSENPWFGMGVEKFKAKYMYYQAAYFSENPNSPFSQIADDVTAPFCEPLKIAIEQGVIGLALFMAIILTALIPVLRKRRSKFEEKPAGKNEEISYIYATILITLLLFSCFSYPFIYIQFLFLLIIGLAVLSSLQPCVKFVVRANKAWLLALIPYTLAACYVSFTGISYALYMKKLHNQIVYFDRDKTEDSLRALTGLEPVLKTNPNYLASYANILFFNKEYESAIEKFTAYLSYHSSYYTFLELGRNYEQLNDTCRALKNWELANRMIPSRFEPLYLQIGLFHRSGQYSRADSLTHLFLHKEQKIDAIRIDRMKKDVREWAKERKIENE